MKNNLTVCLFILFLSALGHATQNAPKPISDRKAKRTAVQLLHAKGVQRVSIHRTTRVDAPLGMVLVDATGNLRSGDRLYSVFRIGIADGTDSASNGPKAKQEILFIAKGVDRNGKVVWNPEPGPLCDMPSENALALEKQYGFVHEYEYLCFDEKNRMIFQQLPLQKFDR